MVLRAVVIAAVLVGTVSEGRAQGQSKGRVAYVVIIDTHTGMLGDRLQTAGMITRLVQRTLPQRARFGLVSSGDGRDVIMKLGGVSSSALERALAKIAVGNNNQVGPGLITANRLLKSHLRGRFNRARVLVIWSQPRRFIPNYWGLQQLNRNGVGVAFVSVDPSAPATPYVPRRRLNSFYVSDGAAPVLPLLRAEVANLRMRWKRGVWKTKRPISNRVQPWWNGKSPCPSPARLQRRIEPGGKLFACKLPDGRLHGRRSTLDGQGFPASDEVYANGKLDGPRRRWGSNGRLASYCGYRRGLRHGEHRTWNARAQLTMLEHYRNGVREGPALIWSGTTVTRARYHAGKPSGTWHVTEISGRTKSTRYRNGVLHGPYVVVSGGNDPEVRGAYRNGRPHGVWRRYYLNGKLKSVGAYRDGKRHGSWRFYLRSGKLRRKEVYANGLIKNTHWY